MKKYKVYIDITIATAIWVDAENEKDAKRFAVEDFYEDPYLYVSDRGSLIDAGVQDVEQVGG